MSLEMRGGGGGGTGIELKAMDMGPKRKCEHAMCCAAARSICLSSSFLRPVHYCARQAQASEGEPQNERLGRNSDDVEL